MPNIKSAIKRTKQNAKRNDRNRRLRSALRTEIKKFRSAVQNKNLEEGVKSLPSIHKAIDKAHSKGVLPKNKASRLKSRLTVSLSKISQA